MHKLKNFLDPRRLWQHFCSDSLFRNSMYLMINSGLMAGLGFLFWIASARLFAPEAIGVVTTVIANATMLANFSLLGFNTAVIRYLPKVTGKNRLLDTSLTVAGGASLLVAVLFLLGLPLISRELLFIGQDAAFAVGFVLLVIAFTSTMLIDDIFIAHCQAKYVLATNSLMSAVKLGLPFVLAGLGVFGLFLSFSIAAAVAVLAAFVLLVWRLGYVYKPRISKQLVAQVMHFSLGNYLVGILLGLPMMVFPLIITNHLGSAQAAYYYMAMTMASLLYVIPTATTHSLFAEGSHDDTRLVQLTIATSKLTALLLAPAIVVLIAGGQFVLLVFGKSYSTEGQTLLQLFAVSGLFYAVNTVLSTWLRVQHRMRPLIVITLIGTVCICVGSYLLISFGINGIGLAWLGGQLLMSILFAAVIWPISRHRRVRRLHALATEK